MKCESSNFVTLRTTQETPVLHEILPLLFIGDYKASHDPSFLVIVNCASNTCVNKNSENIQYLNLDLEDEVDFSLETVLDSSADFIHGALEIGNKVLVHCEYGLSRSAAIIIAYLIKYHKHSYQTALSLIQQVHVNALPNFGFKRQLIEFHHVCQLRECVLQDKFKYKGENPAWINWKEYRSITSKAGKEIGYSKNGKWGQGGANVILLGKILGIWKVLLLERSQAVDNPSTWCFPGGARKIVDGVLEDPINTALQELREEMGCLPQGNLLTYPIMTEDAAATKHYSYILQVNAPNNYFPSLNRENQQWKWYSFDEIQTLGSKLHAGVASVCRELFNAFKI